MKVSYFWGFEGESPCRMGEIDVKTQIEHVEHPKCYRRIYDKEEATKSIIAALKHQYGDDKNFVIELLGTPLIVPKYYYSIDPITKKRTRHLNK